jgi:hypothetical protein
LKLLVPIYVRQVGAIAGFWRSLVGFSSHVRRGCGGRIVRFGLEVTPDCRSVKAEAAEACCEKIGDTMIRGP